jgi:hypothetical protein
MLINTGSQRSQRRHNDRYSGGASQCEAAKILRELCGCATAIALAHAVVVDIVT